MFEFMPTVADLNAVPEQFRGLYVKTDGQDGYTIHEDFTKHVGGLKGALEKERKTVKTLNTSLEAWKALGETPDAVVARNKELEEQLTANKDGKANWDKLKGDLEKGHQTALQTEQAKTAKMQKTLEKHLIEAEAVREVTEAKGSADLLLPHIMTTVKVVPEGEGYVVRVVDADGDFRGNNSGGFMGIKDLVAEMKASPKFGRAFEAAQASGGGKPPAGKGGTPNGQPKSSVGKIASGLAALGR